MWKRRPDMDYFAGLDISMDETHVCVLDREGVVVHESKTASTAEAIAGTLLKAPSCRRIVFETGRMAPILFHGLSQLGLPVVCIESRQAYQALKLLATHKTDRNDARGLAHLARTGFFKPVHVKSLTAHAVRSTTHRRGMTSKPMAASDRWMIWMVKSRKAALSMSWVRELAPLSETVWRVG